MVLKPLVLPLALLLSSVHVVAEESIAVLNASSSKPNVTSVGGLGILPHKQSSKPVRCITTASDNVVVEPLFTIKGHSSSSAYWIELLINTKPVTM